MMGSIYIIKSIEPSLHDFYIGSCKDMKRRMIGHKSHCYNEKRREYNYKLYQFIRANGGWDNWEMVQIGYVWNKATKPLFQIEQDYIDQYKPTLNGQRAYSSEEQRKEYNKNLKKQHREKNRKPKKEITIEEIEQRKLRRKEYFNNRKDIKREYDKNYRIKNIDNKKEYHKKWYENNKDKISEMNKEKFTCECGSILRIDKKTRHLKTKKHQDYISSIQGQS